MAFQHNEKQGSLFKNDKANDRQPDYRGSICINGVNYNLSAWVRKSQKGLEYISLQASDPNDFPRGNAPEQRSTPPTTYNPPVPPQPPISIEDMPADESDLPF